MDPIHRLEEIFTHFPGIGPRQAKRFVHHIQGRNPASIKEFIELIQEIRKTTVECNTCHRFFIDSRVESPNSFSCNICADQNRDRKTLMIVSRDSDFETIEKVVHIEALYFILGGNVPILDKDPEKKIRLKTLLEYLKVIGPSLGEIIISLNTTPDGEHTTEIIKNSIIKTFPDTRISLLGRGLSTGAEIEYADSDTIRYALGNRK